MHSLNSFLVIRVNTKTLPTKLEHVEVFEQTVTSDFSLVNTRLAFGTQILLPNLNGEEDIENNPLNKNFNYKVVYNLKLDGKKAEKKRVKTKILKLNENNQYGNGMTKPLLTGCIKDDSDVSWTTLNMLLQKVNFEEKIGHFFVVDIVFGSKNASEKELAYNDIYPPIIEKQKIIHPCERSVYQSLEQYVEGTNDNPFAHRATKKAHLTMLKKNFLPTYLEHLVFVIKRAGWKVTKIHAHLEVADNFDKKIKKNKRRLNLIDYTKRKDEALRDQKIKSLMGLDEEL